MDTELCITAMIGGTKRGNLKSEEQNTDRRRSRLQQSSQSNCACITRCTDDTELLS